MVASGECAQVSNLWTDPALFQLLLLLFREPPPPPLFGLQHAPTHPQRCSRSAVRLRVGCTTSPHHTPLHCPGKRRGKAIMHPLWFIAGAAGVTGILLASDNLTTSQLAEEWAVKVPDFFCKAGNGPEEALFRLGGDFFPVIVPAVILFIIVTVKFIRFVPLRVVAVTAIIYTLTVAIIGFMRNSPVTQIQTICSTIAARTQGTLQTEAKDLILPFLTPLRYLPDKPFTDDLAMRTYAIIYPHLGEYCLTVEPLLPYAFVIFGILLEFRPIKNKFWQYLPIIGAVVSFITMALAHTSEFVRVEPYDLLLNTILQYVIFYLATFAMLSILVVLFRLGMRRVSVLALFLTFSRLHSLGMPALDFHVNMVLIIFLIALLVTTCEFSPGAFVLYALAAYYNQWKTIEWGLVVMLLDNFFYRAVVAIKHYNEHKGQHGTKTKTE